MLFRHLISEEIRVIVELGTWFGQSTLEFLRLARQRLFA